MTAYNDIALLTAVAGGDQKAFATLFERHKDRVYQVALRLTDNEFVAEELVQDVFVRVWKNKDKLKALDDFPSWLYTVTRNRAITALQKIAREEEKRAEFISWLPDQTTDPGKKTDEHYVRQLLETALSRLTKQQRRVFELSRLQGFTREEIAREMGLAPATVSVHLTIALRSVRAFLTSRIEYTILLVSMAGIFMP